MDETLWYLHHEDYWCVMTALTEYHRILDTAPEPVRTEGRARADALQSRLREVR